MIKIANGCSVCAWLFNESAREKNIPTKEDIERYITTAKKLSAKQMVELLVERIDVFADKICIRLKYSDTPPETPTDFSDGLSTQMDAQPDRPHNYDNPDRSNSCRGFLLFSFTKAHEISQTLTYKSNLSRIFTYTRTFILEIYI